MLRVGLTGGIGCGKSTVAEMMRELGCRIVEADKIAHRLIEPGQAAYDEVVREFGGAILSTATAPNQMPRIDRARLAAIVFASDAAAPARLARLNAIIHPLVLAEEDREFARLGGEDPRGVAVVVAALLVEAGFHKRLDRLVVVWCTPEQQLKRLTDAASGRALTRAQAQSRIAAQMDLNEKRKVADDEIDNSGTLEETQRQVAALVARLKQQAASVSTGRPGTT
jgi:dephospho-CoA kinase